jgi:prepilin-type N-terminal cleavage/methylation domain-containing protein
MILFKKSKNTDKKAFTLIELMITCLIIAVVVAIALPNYWTAHLRAQERKAITMLYAFSHAEEAYWFDQDPNAYTSNEFDLIPDYIDATTDDGDWQYSLNGGANTFSVTATHNRKGLSITLDKNGTLTYGGSWPY